MFEPQITGGVEPPGLDTLKVSVRHWEAEATSTPFVTAGRTWPFNALPMLSDNVDGPVMTNMLKSRRSYWKKKSFKSRIRSSLQISYLTNVARTGADL